MPFHSRFPLKPPHTSIPSFIFGDPVEQVDTEKKLLIDAENPETNYFTLSTYRTWSQRFAAGLLATGFQTGDRVLLFAGNSLWTPIVVMGTIMAGGIYTSANPAFTPRELCHQLKDSEPRFILVAENCWDRAIRAAEQLGIEKGSIFLFTDLKSQHENPQYWRHLIASPETASRSGWLSLNTASECNKTAVLMYSSGTSGTPKGVEVSHYNIISNILQYSKLQLSDKLMKDRRSLCVLPLYHGLGLVYYTFLAPKCNVQVYVMERFNINTVFRHIHDFQITELLLVPPILATMADSPKAREYNLRSVRKVLAGAAPLGMELTKRFEALFDNGLRVRQAWGMTEAPCITLCWDECSPSTISSTSVGELVSGTEAKLLSDSGQEINQPGESGELYLRAPNIMKGYWRNSGATQETKTHDGWLRTGDVAYRDEEGMWFIVDRKKELIKVRGAQVAPAELEALLLEHPGVGDAAVVGVRTRNDDEAPRAYIIPRPSMSVTAEDITSYVASRVIKIKRLTGGVVFVKAIPKNPSGKILRREIREWARKGNSEGAAKL